MFYFSIFIYKKRGFILKSSPSEKNVVAEEELDYIDGDDIENIEDSPRLMFIDEEYGNLILVPDGRDLTRNINQKRSHTLFNSL